MFAALALSLLPVAPPAPAAAPAAPAAVVSIAAPAVPAGIRWRADLRAAHADAAAAGKPMLLLFGADWCHYCHKQTDETLSDPALVARINANFVPVRLDFDADAKLAEILEVKTLPQAVLLSPDADLLGRAAGFHDVSQFGQALAGARQTFRRLNPARIAAAPAGAGTF